MLFFKQAVLILMLSLGFATYSQTPNKENIDKRVIENKGAQEASQIFKNRRDYYEFLVFELNNTCELIQASDLPKDAVVSHDQTFLSKTKLSKFEEDVRNNQLNSKKYNLPQKHEQPVFVRLHDNVVLRINSVMTIKKEFLKTGKQNSK